MYRLIDFAFGFDVLGMLFKEYEYGYNHRGELVAIKVKAKHIVEMNRRLMSPDKIEACLIVGEDYGWVYYMEELEYCGEVRSNEKRNNSKG